MSPGGGPPSPGGGPIGPSGPGPISPSGGGPIGPSGPGPISPSGGGPSPNAASTLSPAASNASIASIPLSIAESKPS